MSFDVVDFSSSFFRPFRPRRLFVAFDVDNATTSKATKNDDVGTAKNVDVESDENDFESDEKMTSKATKLNPAKI